MYQNQILGVKIWCLVDSEPFPPSDGGRWFFWFFSPIISTNIVTYNGSLVVVVMATIFPSVVGWLVLWLFLCIIAEQVGGATTPSVNFRISRAFPCFFPIIVVHYTYQHISMCHVLWLYPCTPHGPLQYIHSMCWYYSCRASFKDFVTFVQDKLHQPNSRWRISFSLLFGLGNSSYKRELPKPNRWT